MKHGLGSISVAVNRVLDDLLPDPPYQQDLYVKNEQTTLVRVLLKLVTG